MKNKILNLKLGVLAFAFTMPMMNSCTPSVDEFKSIHTAKKDQIAKIELKPQNIFLLADGKATLDFTPRTYVKNGEKYSLMIPDRVNPDWFEVISDVPEVKSLSYSTSNPMLYNKDIKVKVRVKGTDIESNSFTFKVLENNSKFKDVVFPVVFHIITEKGSYDKSGVSYSKELISELVAKWNMVFKGEITNNPVGVDTHIRFKLAKYGINGNKLPEEGINRVFLPDGTMKDKTDIIQIIQQNQLDWDPTKYLNIWLYANAEQHGSDLLSSLCKPIATNVDGLPEGIETKMDFPLKLVYDGIMFKAEEIKQLNKKYDTFYGYRAGYNELIHYLGIYFGLLNNNNFRTKAKPGEDFCDDTQGYAVTNKYFGQNKTDLKETDLCFFSSENIMDDPTGFHTSVSREQSIRMRWVIEHCNNRMSWKSTFAFQGK